MHTGALIAGRVLNLSDVKPIDVCEGMRDRATSNENICFPAHAPAVKIEFALVSL